MPYKDKEKQREANRESMKKRRLVSEGLHKEVTRNEGYTSGLHEPLPFDELPIKERGRLEYIQSWLSGYIISGIESAYLYFRKKNPDMRNANRLLRYENAYKYGLFELGY